jgi:ABC-type multidrug transport system ATPase subunit
MALLSINQLTKRYRNGTLANDGISVAVEPGEVYGLLGPNGAGKTTLVNQVLGLLKPTSGTIHLDSVDIIANPGFARANIGFLPQGVFDLEGARVQEVITAVASLRGLRGEVLRSSVRRVVEQLDLGDFRKTSLSSASGGVKRLVGLACAIVARPRMLVLDEPTNDIDPVRRQLLWAAITDLRRDGATVLLVTHNLAEAERVIDRFAIIDRGRILQQGTLAALRHLAGDRLRLVMTASAAVARPPWLVGDASEGTFLFEPARLADLSRWLQEERDRGRVSDFHIGPPTLDDIYLAAIGNGDRREVA